MGFFLCRSKRKGDSQLMDNWLNKKSTAHPNEETAVQFQKHNPPLSPEIQEMENFLVNHKQAESQECSEEQQVALLPLGGQKLPPTVITLKCVRTSNIVDLVQEHEQVHKGILSKTQQPLPALRTKPNQPKGMFPATNKRRFQEKWYDRFPWVEYNAEVDAAFCHPCHQISSQNINLIGKVDDAFAKCGFSSWHKANEVMTGHEKSSSHKEAIWKFQALLKNENVHSKLNIYNDTEKKNATECLTEIFTSLRYLARQGLACRGHDDANSNFQQLLKLRTTDNVKLSNWLMRKTNWTSPEIQNEMLEIMANSILRKICQDCVTGKYFSILVDETADTSRTEQMCITIRTCNESLEAEEKVLGLYALDRCNSETIYNAIMDVLVRCGLDLRNCYGQCYDGASTMSGHISGVAARILQTESRAVFTHCQMHSLNLAIQDTMSSISQFRDFFNLMQELVVFLRDSSQRCEIVKTVALQVKCSQNNIRPLCPTRFTMKFRALDGLLKQLEILPLALNEISENTSDSKMKSLVSGFDRRIHEHDFLFCLLLAHKIFEKTDILSKRLQDPKVSSGEGIKLCQITSTCIKKLRSTEAFEDL